jgi:uncharacterized protein
MPKKKPRSALSGIVFIAILAATVFVAGEAWLLLKGDRGSLAWARYSPWGNQAEVTRLVARQLREGLQASGVHPDSIREVSPEGGSAKVRWRVGLGDGASFLQLNHALTTKLAESGVEVSGRERYARDGELEVVLLAEMGGIATHELVVRRSRDPAGQASGDVRIALVVYGFGDDEALARSFIELQQPFAVALAPARPTSSAWFRAAREAGREVVLHLALEPINYPQVNPGPGTLLVTMKPAEVTNTVRKYLGQAGSVAAVTNHMGSLATQDMAVMSAVYRELRRQKVPFLHMTPVAGSVCKSLAADIGVVYDEPHDVLDREALSDGTRALDQKWRQVLEGARARGSAIVMLRATPRSREWLSQVLAVKRLKGVNIVPLAALLRPPAV